MYTDSGSDRNEDLRMGMRPHAKRPCEKRKHQGETEGREYHREGQESVTEMVWPRKEAIPRLHRKKDSGDGTTREKKARKTEESMRAIRTTKDEVHDRTGWRRIVSAAKTPQRSGSG